MKVQYELEDGSTVEYELEDAPVSATETMKNSFTPEGAVNAVRSAASEFIAPFKPLVGPSKGKLSYAELGSLLGRGMNNLPGGGLVTSTMGGNLEKAGQEVRRASEESMGNLVEARARKRPNDPIGNTMAALSGGVINTATALTPFTPSEFSLSAGADIGSAIPVELPINFAGKRMINRSTPETLAGVRAAEKYGVDLPIGARTESPSIQSTEASLANRIGGRDLFNQRRGAEKKFQSVVEGQAGERFGPPLGQSDAGNEIQGSFERGFGAKEKAFKRMSDEAQSVVKAEDELLTARKQAEAERLVSQRKQGYQNVEKVISKKYGEPKELTEVGNKLREGQNKVYGRYKKAEDEAWERLRTEAGDKPVSSNKARQFIEKEFDDKGIKIVEDVADDGTVKYSIKSDLEAVDINDYTTLFKIWKDLNKGNRNVKDLIRLRQIADSNSNFDVVRSRGMEGLYKKAAGVLREDIAESASKAGKGNIVKEATEASKKAIRYIESDAAKNISSLDPERIYGSIVRPKSATRIKQAFQDLDNDSKNVIRSRFMDDVFGEGDPRAIHKKLNSFEDEDLDAIFANDSGVIKRFRDLSKRVSDSDMFKVPKIEPTARRVEIATPFTDLENKAAKSVRNVYPDKVVQSILATKSTDKISTIKKGLDEKGAVALKRGVIDQWLEAAVDATRGAGGEISPEKLATQINKYSDDALKEIFDKDFDMVDDIRKIANAFRRGERFRAGSPTSFLADVGQFFQLNVIPLISRLGMRGYASRALTKPSMKQFITEGTLPSNSFMATKAGLKAAGQGARYGIQQMRTPYDEE